MRQVQQAMQEMIRSRLTTVQRLEITAGNIPERKLLDAVMNQDIDMIRRSLDEISKDEFYRAADAVVNARHVYILGARSSLPLANFLAYYFKLLFDSVHLINSTSEAEIFEQMIHLSPEDAVIGISFPRYSRKAVKAMRFASDRGASTVAITDSALSPMAEAATYLLRARSDIASIVDSLVAPLSVINAFIVTVAIKKKDEVHENLQSLERIWDDYGVYEKVDEKGIDTIG